MFRQTFMKMDEANPEGSNGGGGAKTVSYETYSKLLSEKKSVDAKFKEVNAKLDEMQNAQLEQKGELQKSLDSYKQKYKDLTDKNLGLVKKLSEKAIRSQFKVEAAKLGCVDDELAFKACDFSDIELNDDLEFDSSKLVPKIQELAKTKSYLFKKSVQVPKNENPNNKQETNNDGQKKLTDLPTAELISMLGKVK